MTHEHTLLTLANDIEDLRKTIANFYLPKHVESMTGAVGRMEQCAIQSQHSIQNCYLIISLVFFLLIVWCFLKRKTLFILNHKDSCKTEQSVVMIPAKSTHKRSQSI